MTIAIPPLLYLKIEANYVLSISAHNAFLCPLKQMNAFDLLSLSAFTSWRHVYHGVYGGFFSFFDGSNFLDIDPVWFSPCYSKQLHSKFSRFRRFVSDKCRRNNIPIWSTVVVLRYVNRSLGNDDGDVNESCKKAMGLSWQNNNFTRASRFFVHFFAVTTRLRRENAQIHVLWRTWTQLDNDFLFLFLNSETVLLELSFRNNCQHLKNWPRWNKRDKVWLFNWRFRTVVVVAAFPNLNTAVVFF